MTDRDKLIFAPCDVLLPPYNMEEKEKWEKWAVIACDQHTSDVDYWSECEELVDGAPSTLDLILPEAYLGTKKESSQKCRVDCAQKSMDCGWLRRFKHSMIYVERTLSNGKVRRGIVGKIDLEHYDFSKDSASAVRPTEGTVAERIVPRVEIRKKASLELPHIMVFMNDGGYNITAECAARRDRMKKLYDFELMKNGGRIAGYLMNGDVLEEVLEIIAKFESEKAASGEMMYGVGDGNHSLATARAIYSELKEEMGGFAQNLKARYAAVEMISIDDDSVEFEPIYRLAENVDAENFRAEITGWAQSASGETREITLVGENGETKLNIPADDGELTVGAVQGFIDRYIEEHPETAVDYIHGEDTLREVSSKKNAVGILFDGMKKSELFPYVESKGPLPKKTFSMGSADTKRYYLEVRKIKAE